MDSGFQQGTDSTNDPPRARPVAQLEERALGHPEALVEGSSPSRSFVFWLLAGPEFVFGVDYGGTSQ